MTARTSPTDMPCLFGVGTGRSGGWLVTNIMSVHSQVMAFNERVHFFRFYFGKYDPLVPANVERMIRHLCLRVDMRFGLKLEPEPIIAKIIGGGEITYRSCYLAIMGYLAGLAGRPIWAEYAPMTWRSVPNFMGMFPQNGRIFHIFRDPRAVLASWKRMSFMPDNLYLNQIFNWIDSINHLRRYRDIYPAERFLAIRFEDLHRRSVDTVGAICRLMGVPVEPQQLQPERWLELFDQRFVEANVSAHDGERKYGFNTALIDNWPRVLTPWEIALVEFLAGPQMDALGYERSGKASLNDLRYGIDRLREQPFLLRNLQTLLAIGEGTQDLPNDPTKPENWSAGEGYFGKFVETPQYAEYLQQLDAIEALARTKSKGRK